MQPPQVQVEATQEITIKLQAQEWQVVLEALAERPFRIAAPVIGKFNEQFGAAVGQPAPTNGAQDPAALPH